MRYPNIIQFTYSEDDEVVFDSLTIQDIDLDAAAVAGSFFSAAAISPELVEMMATESQEIRLHVNYGVKPAILEDPDENLIVESGSTDNLGIEDHELEIAFTPQIISDNNIDDQTPTIDFDFNLSHNVGKEEYFRDEQVINNDDTTNIYFLRDGLPGAGEYQITNNVDDLDDFTFYLPDVIDQAEKHLILPVITVELYEDDNDKLIIDRISWAYKNLDGEELSNPEKIVTGQEVQISSYTDNKDELLGDYTESGEENSDRIYGSGPIPDVSNTALDLNHENIYWDDVENITIAYDDLYNIHFLTGYNVDR